MSCPKFYIMAGYKASFTVTVQKDGVVQNLTGKTITAAITDVNRFSTAIQPVAQSDTATGADWANGIVVVEFSNTDTVNVKFASTYQLILLIDDEPWVGPVVLGDSLPS